MCWNGLSNKIFKFFKEYIFLTPIYESTWKHVLGSIDGRILYFIIIFEIFLFQFTLYLHCASTWLCFLTLPSTTLPNLTSLINKCCWLVRRVVNIPNKCKPCIYWPLADHGHQGTNQIACWSLPTEEAITLHILFSNGNEKKNLLEIGDLLLMINAVPF